MGDDYYKDLKRYLKSLLIKRTNFRDLLMEHWEQESQNYPYGEGIFIEGRFYTLDDYDSAVGLLLKEMKASRLH